MAKTARSTTITFVAVMLVAATLGLLPGGPTRAQGAEPAALIVTPTEGETGTAVTVQGEGCFLEDGVTAADGVIVVMETDSGKQLASVTAQVSADGAFNERLVIPSGVPVGTHHLRGTCVSPELPELGSYDGGTFTVTGEGEHALTLDEAAAAAEAISSRAAGGIEPYPAYDGQSTCSPSAKPGTLAFSQNTLATFTNTGTYGISRECGIGGLSEHKEGRAWDWKADARNAAQHRSVDQMLDWLLATDAQGNRHAMARRLGIMYIIWDRQMFRMYRVNDGWQPYHGSHPHTDHVHISFTRAGGNKRTSYWSMGSPPAWGGRGSVGQPQPPSGPDRATFEMTRRDIRGSFTPVSGDFDGDRHQDVIWYGVGDKPDYIWWGRGGGQFQGVRTTLRGRFVPIGGDFDGDGRDDVIWYGAGGRPDYVWWGGAGRRLRSQAISVAGTYRPPVSGDFDGDGRDDVFWYGRARARDWIWWGKPNRTFAGTATAVGGTYRPPFTGDFDGDGRDDIYWYGKGSAPDFKWFGRADRRFDGANASMDRSRRPLTGRFNGDRQHDVLWYAPGAPRDGMWLGTADRGFTAQSIANVSGTYDGAFVADLDGNGRDDIFWYDPSDGADYIWWF